MEHLREVLIGVLLLLAIYRLTRPRRPPIDLAARRFRPPWRNAARGGGREAGGRREAGGGREAGDGGRRARRRLSFRR